MAIWLWYNSTCHASDFHTGRFCFSPAAINPQINICGQTALSLLGNPLVACVAAAAAEKGRFAMFTPKNEQGVVVAFSQVCESLGFEVATIQTAYPDAILHDRILDKTIRAEFEYHANNFRTHGHDPSGVDLIICWERGRSKFSVPILELSTLATYPPHLYQKYLPPRKIPKKPSRPRTFTPEALENLHNPRRTKYQGSCPPYFNLHLSERRYGNGAQLFMSYEPAYGLMFEVSNSETTTIAKLIWHATTLAKKAGIDGTKDPTAAERMKDLALRAVSLLRRGKDHCRIHLKRFAKWRK